MSNSTCPSCGKDAMSNWEKINLTIFKSKNCSNCNTELTVPFYSIFIPALPLLFLLFLSLTRTLDNQAINPGLILFSFPIMIYLLSLVPLRKAKK